MQLQARAAPAPALCCSRRALRRAAAVAAGGRGLCQPADTAVLRCAPPRRRRGAVAMAGGKESEMKKVEPPVSVPVRACPTP